MRKVISQVSSQPVIKLFRKVDTVEYQGQTRQIILVAKVVKFKMTTVSQDEELHTSKGRNRRVITETTSTEDVSKLGLGLSVCNPGDTYDETYGTSKAASRALNRKDTLGIIDSSDKSISTELVNFVLKAKLKHIKKYPQYYIADLKSAKVENVPAAINQ